MTKDQNKKEKQLSKIMEFILLVFMIYFICFFIIIFKLEDIESLIKEMKEQQTCTISLN